MDEPLTDEEIKEFKAIVRQVQLISSSGCISFGHMRDNSSACWGDCHIADVCYDLTKAPARIAAVQDIAELPKFLTSMFSEVRELAVQRLKELEANEGYNDAGGEGTS